MLSSGFACSLRGALRGRFASRHASTRRPRVPCGPGGGWRHRRPARPSCFRSASGLGEAPPPHPQRRVCRGNRPPSTSTSARTAKNQFSPASSSRDVGCGRRVVGSYPGPPPAEERGRGGGAGGPCLPARDWSGGAEAGGGAELSRPSGDHQASHARPTRKAAKNRGWG